MKVKNLENIEFDQIADCFLAAFQNYFVEMPTDKNYYKARWDMAKVDFKLSFGMFDDDCLVGFIINAIDQRNGNRVAYNTGTGVLPEYRGKKIIKTIYQHAIPILIQNGITKCQLEVITTNEIAIKSYQSIGFDICKLYKSYRGKINVTKGHSLDLEEMNTNNIQSLFGSNQMHYSWDNQLETIARGNYKYYQVKEANNIMGHFIINPNSGYIAQFDVAEQSEYCFTILSAAILKVTENVKIINVDNQLKNKINFLNFLKLENFINQYEMELLLS